MINTLKKITTDNWLEITSGVAGVSSSLVLNWQHITERAIETLILAIVSGGSAAISGYIAILIIKKILPTK